MPGGNYYRTVWFLTKAQWVAMHFCKRDAPAIFIAMIKQVLIPLLALLALPVFLSLDNERLLNRPVPLLLNKTLDGRTIDEAYYRGHITLVSFMYIGCPPCMNEINILNRIEQEYRSDGRVQLLCVARQMRRQMLDFNSTNETLFSKMRKVFGADSIRYAIQPACNDTTSKMVTNGDHVNIKSECTTIEERYGIEAYPTMLYVDRKGLVRKVARGGPAQKNDSAFYNGVKAELDKLLAEPGR